MTFPLGFVSAAFLLGALGGIIVMALAVMAGRSGR